MNIYEQRLRAYLQEQHIPAEHLSFDQPCHSVAEALYGRVSISEDPALVRQDIEHLVERYVKDEGIRPQVSAALVQQSRVALHFTPEKVTEFSV